MEREESVCLGCQRKIVKNTHDKCLYCGYAFPAEYRLSDLERREKEVDEKIFKHKQRMSKNAVSDVFTHIERHKGGGI